MTGSTQGLTIPAPTGLHLSESLSSFALSPGHAVNFSIPLARLDRKKAVPSHSLRHRLQEVAQSSVKVKMPACSQQLCICNAGHAHRQCEQLRKQAMCQEGLASESLSAVSHSSARSSAVTVNNTSKHQPKPILREVLHYFYNWISYASPKTLKCPYVFFKLQMTKINHLRGLFDLYASISPSRSHTRLMRQH